MLEQQRAASAIVGALAHEVNNPLQGILSLAALLGRDTGGEHAQLQLEQIRSGLSRISRVVESFSVVYENLPRAPDYVLADRMTDWLSAALAARQFRCELAGGSVPAVPIVCFGPETARLVADALSQPSPDGRTVRITTESSDGRLVLTCQRSQSGEAAWEQLETLGGFSGLATLIAELMHLCQGECGFRLDTASLSGIRLVFRTRMG